MDAASSPIRLPKLIEQDPRAPQLLRILSTNTRSLWSGAQLEIAEVDLTPALSSALRSAHASGRVVRGLEAAERVLDAEERGLRHAAQLQTAERGARISRLMLLADDGADRFYRHVERLLLRHSPRVTAMQVAADAAEFGSLLYGPDHPARLLMIAHKDAVCAVLLSLVAAEGR